MGADSCKVCLSLVHGYLTACPACGTHRSSGFAWAVYDWVHRDEPYSFEEARDRLTTDDYEPSPSRIESDTTEPRWEMKKRAAELWIKPRKPSGPTDLDALDRAWRERGEPGMTDEQRQKFRAMDKTMAESERQMSRTRETLFGRELLDKHLVAGKDFQYLGGLPSYPNPLDVVVRANESGLQVSEKRSGSVVAVVPYSSILAATGQSDRMQLGWFGLALGNAIAFGQPTIDVGAWVLTFGSDGNVRQVAFGARRAGFFGSTQTADFFRVLSLLLRPPVKLHSDYAEALQGPVNYARNLGLPTAEAEELVTGTEADEQSIGASAEPNDPRILAAKFEQLKSLAELGYITDTEYEAKRAELLSRI